jgi:hypothetical protein
MFINLKLCINLVWIETSSYISIRLAPCFIQKSKSTTMSNFDIIIIKQSLHIIQTILFPNFQIGLNYFAKLNDQIEVFIHNLQTSIVNCWSHQDHMVRKLSITQDEVHFINKFVGRRTRTKKNWKCWRSLPLNIFIICASNTHKETYKLWILMQQINAHKSSIYICMSFVQYTTKATNFESWCNKNQWADKSFDLDAAN